MRLVWQTYFQDLQPDQLERGFRRSAFPSSNYAFISVMYNLTCFFDIEGVSKMSVSSMQILTCLCNEIAVYTKIQHASVINYDSMKHIYVKPYIISRLQINEYTPSIFPMKLQISEVTCIFSQSDTQYVNWSILDVRTVCRSWSQFFFYKLHR